MGRLKKTFKLLIILQFWLVIFFHAEFQPEFNALDPEVQDELLAHAKFVERIWATAQAPYGRHPSRINARQHEGAEV
jgi:hypothetical protein